jgi:hypothetical protein
MHYQKEIRMNQKLTIILAASITAFILVLSGAIISRTTRPASAASAADVAEIYTQREGEYQSRLEEANAALAAAYAQSDSAAQAQADNTASLEPSISTQDALLVAALRAPNAALLRNPELVLFQGNLAYEITLDQGVIYVDATSGALLYDGTTQVQNTSQARSYDHDDEHGEYDDD